MGEYIADGVGAERASSSCSAFAANKDRQAELEPLLEESVQTYPRDFLLLSTYCELGKTDDAQRLLDELAPATSSSDSPGTRSGCWRDA